MTLYIRLLCLSIGIALAFSFNTQAQASIESLNKVVAVVNDTAITQNELNSRIELARKQKASLSPAQGLEELIMEQIQLQRATQMGVTIPDSKLNAMVEGIAKQNHMSLVQFQEVIKNEGMAFEDYKNSLKTQQLIGYVRQRSILDSIEVTDKEVDHFLNSALNMAQLQNAQSAQYHIGHILIALPQDPTAIQIKQAQKQAQILLKKLKANETVSLEDLGWRKTDELPTLFLNTVPSMAKNEIQGPIQSESGFHIIKLLDKHVPQNNLSKNPAEQRQQIQNIIKNRKANEKLTGWLQKLRSEAYVQNYLEEPLEDTQEPDAHTS